MWYLFLILAISSTLGIPVNNDESGERGNSRLLTHTTHIPFIFVFQETFKAFIVSRLLCFGLKMLLKAGLSD